MKGCNANKGLLTQFSVLLQRELRTIQRLGRFLQNSTKWCGQNIPSHTIIYIQGLLKISKEAKDAKECPIL